MMWQQIKDKSYAFHQSFHNSGTILFGRLQVLIGAVWTVLTVTDLAPVIANPKYLTAWLIFSGVITEMTRRSNSRVDEDNHLAPRDEKQTVNVTVNTTAAPAPASPVPTDGTTK